MSEFFKDYKSCKKFKFNINGKKDLERILHYFQSREFTPVPRDLLMEAQ